MILQLILKPTLKCFLFLWLACLLATPVTAQTKKTEFVVMKDKVKLSTDVYLPKAEGKFPTILLRTPYDKNHQRLTNFVAEAMNREYAVVIQDTRGRFASEGENLPFIGDGLFKLQDGEETLKWIRQQPWCSGKVGTYGGSALGFTQILMSDSFPGLIQAQHINVSPFSMYSDFVYPGGIFKKHVMEFWLTNENFNVAALKEWREHPTFDRYWLERDIRQRIGKTSAPAIHIGGYYDLFAPATVEAFQALQEFGGKGAARKQKLVLGPWTHVTFIEHSGELKFPGADKPPSGVHDHWKMFDFYLKGVTNGFDKDPAVTYYVMGDIQDPQAPGKVWKTAETWPPPFNKRTFTFGPNKKLMDGNSWGDQNISYTYDPKDPAPTVGGLQFFKGITAGSKDQGDLEKRKDVLNFTSDKLTQPLEIAGSPEVELMVSITQPDTDLFVKVCDVYPDGKSYNISEGQIRLRYRNDFAQPTPMNKLMPTLVRVPMSPTSIVFNKGHLIRLQITSSSVPGFEPHPNTWEFKEGESNPVSVRIGTGSMSQPYSKLVLPMTIAK